MCRSLSKDDEFDFQGIEEEEESLSGMERIMNGGQRGEGAALFLTLSYFLIDIFISKVYECFSTQSLLIKKNLKNNVLFSGLFSPHPLLSLVDAKESASDGEVKNRTSPPSSSPPAPPALGLNPPMPQLSLTVAELEASQMADSHPLPAPLPAPAPLAVPVPAKASKMPSEGTSVLCYSFFLSFNEV